MSKKWAIPIFLLFCHILFAQDENSLKLPELIIYNPDSAFIKPGKIIKFTTKFKNVKTTPVLKVRKNIFLPQKKKLPVIPQYSYGNLDDLMHQVSLQAGYNQWLDVNYTGVLTKGAYYNKASFDFENLKPNSDHDGSIRSFKIDDEFNYNHLNKYMFNLRFGFLKGKNPVNLLDTLRYLRENQSSLSALPLFTSFERETDNITLVPEFQFKLNNQTHTFRLNYDYFTLKYSDAESENNSSSVKLNGLDRNVFGFDHISEFITGFAPIKWFNSIRSYKCKLTDMDAQYTGDTEFDYLYFHTTVWIEKNDARFSLSPVYVSTDEENKWYLDFSVRWKRFLDRNFELALEGGHETGPSQNRFLSEPGEIFLESADLISSLAPERFFYGQIFARRNFEDSFILSGNLGYRIYKEYAATSLSWETRSDLYGPGDGYFISQYFLHRRNERVDANSVFLDFEALYQEKDNYKILTTLGMEFFHNVSDENYRTSVFPDSAAIDYSYLEVDKVYDVPVFRAQALATKYFPGRISVSGHLDFISSCKVNRDIEQKSFVSLDAEARKKFSRSFELYVNIFNLLNREQVSRYPYMTPGLTAGLGFLYSF